MGAAAFNSRLFSNGSYNSNRKNHKASSHEEAICTKSLLPQKLVSRLLLINKNCSKQTINKKTTGSRKDTAISLW